MQNDQRVQLLLTQSDFPRRLLVVGPEGCGKTRAVHKAASKFGVKVKEYSLSQFLYLPEEALTQRLEGLQEDAETVPRTVPIIQHMQGLTIPIIDGKSDHRTSRNAAVILSWLADCSRWILEVQLGMAPVLCILRQLADYELRLSSPTKADFEAALKDVIEDANARQRIGMAAENMGINLRDLSFAVKMVATLNGQARADALLEIVNGRVFQ